MAAVSLARLFCLIIELDEADIWIGSDGQQLHVASVVVGDTIPLRLRSQIDALHDDLVAVMPIMSPEEHAWLLQ